MSGPLSDTLRGRIALSYNTYDGSWDNQAEPSAGIGGFKTKNLSGVLDWRPTDAFTAKIFGYRTEDVRDSSAAYVVPAYNCGRPAGRCRRSAAKCPRPTRWRRTRIRSPSSATSRLARWTCRTTSGASDQEPDGDLQRQHRQLLGHQPRPEQWRGAVWHRQQRGADGGAAPAEPAGVQRRRQGRVARQERGAAPRGPDRRRHELDARHLPVQERVHQPVAHRLRRPRPRAGRAADQRHLLLRQQQADPRRRLHRPVEQHGHAVALRRRRQTRPHTSARSSRSSPTSGPPAPSCATTRKTASASTRSQALDRAVGRVLHTTWRARRLRADAVAAVLLYASAARA